MAWMGARGGRGGRGGGGGGGGRGGRRESRTRKPASTRARARARTEAAAAAAGADDAAAGGPASAAAVPASSLPTPSRQQSLAATTAATRSSGAPGGGGGGSVRRAECIDDENDGEGLGDMGDQTECGSTPASPTTMSVDPDASGVASPSDRKSDTLLSDEDKASYPSKRVKQAMESGTDAADAEPQQGHPTTWTPEDSAMAHTDASSPSPPQSTHDPTSVHQSTEDSMSVHHDFGSAESGSTGAGAASASKGRMAVPGPRTSSITAKPSLVGKIYEAVTSLFAATPESDVAINLASALDQVPRNHAAVDDLGQLSENWRALWGVFCEFDKANHERNNKDFSRDVNQLLAVLARAAGNTQMDSSKLVLVFLCSCKLLQ
ncbi:hypothetical protein DFJ73DRAFT_780701 [Zopfochytrium polystomum]|nr:hypothetical protein DFJ73DRAFT_780701 [Zopfochytrium polystomum]